MNALPRSLPLAGASNFRDLGGYTGQDGRTVRWRTLFRSDHLGALTAEDQAVLAGLKLSRSVDFRGAAERGATPYALPGVMNLPMPIEPTVVQRMKDLVLNGQEMSPAGMVLLMQETYRAFVNDNALRFAGLFDQLLDSDAPLVFHCTAGKDRTGFAAALILLALGVPRDVVMHDYLLTNDLLSMEGAPHSVVPADVIRVLWRVQEEFLHAALDAVDADHGGVDAYLTQQIGISAAGRRRLADLYLQR